MILFPSTRPATPGVARIVLREKTMVGMSASPFTGAQQTYQWPGEWWEADVTLPPMARAAAEPWLAFLSSLRGRAGTFFLGDPAGKTPQGSVPGSPLVNGASQAGTTLQTKGWTPSQNGVLLAGDYIQLGPALAVPPAPTLTQVSSGALAATTYYAAITYTAANGETWVGAEAALAVSVNNVLRVASPPAVTGATGWNVYVSTATGAETLQNAAPIAIGTAWQEPNTGLISGAATPIAQTRLHKVLNTANSDSGGLATLDIFPRLRESPNDAAVITVTSCVGTFRLAENVTQWDADAAKIYAIGFKAVEAF